MLALEEAIAREESQPPQTEPDSAEQDPDLLRDEHVTLRQRAWPFVEMMKRAHAENAQIVWGICSGPGSDSRAKTFLACQFHERHGLAGHCASQTERARRQRRAAASNCCIPTPSRARVSRCSNQARSCGDSTVRSANSTIH